MDASGRRREETNRRAESDMQQQQQQKIVSTLSSTSLQQHGQADAINGLKALAESNVQEEATQSYQQALSERQSAVRGLEVAASNSPRHTTNPATMPTVEELLAQTRRLYRPISTPQVTPMQRFSTMSAVHDPFPLGAKRAMSEMDLEYGSLESVAARVEAASIVAGDAKSTEEFRDHPDARAKVRSAPAVLPSQHVRVSKPKRMFNKRRPESADDGEQSGKRSRNR